MSKKSEPIFSGYIGKHDLMDYGKRDSFAGEPITGERYGFTIKNKSATDKKVVALSYAQYTSLTALQKKFPEANVLLKDGLTSEVEVTALKSKNPVNEFLKYTQAKPTRVVGLALDTDDKANFNYQIEVFTGVSPFKDAKSEVIDLREFVDANQQQTDRSNLDLIKSGVPMVFSDESVILVTILPESQIRFNMTIGAKISLPTYLNKRAEIADEQLVEMGQR